MIARNQIPVVVMSSLALLIVFLLGCSSDSQSEKSTETTSSFIKTISNNTIASSRKSKFGLPPEIMRMIT